MGCSPRQALNFSVYWLMKAGAARHGNNERAP
jgi:hypothetical protein